MRFVLADVSADQLRDACGRDPAAVCREILERTESTALAKVGDAILGTPLTIVVIAACALLLNRFAGRLIDRALRGVRSNVVRERMTAVRRRGPGAVVETPESIMRSDQRLDALTSILRSVAGFAILLLASFMVLSELGVDVAPLIAGAGIVGIAIAFGSQSLVKDFLNGVFILAEDQFGVGDVVEFDPQVNGTVEAVSLRTTRLRGVDGTVWHVPNGAIVRVGNKSQHWGRAMLDVEVAADTDIDHAEHLIKRVSSALYGERTDILEVPEVRGVEKRGDDALAIRLLVKTLPADREAVGDELLRRLWKEFEREGIERPASAARPAGGEDGASTDAVAGRRDEDEPAGGTPPRG